MKEADTKSDGSAQGVSQSHVNHKEDTKLTKKGRASPRNLPSGGDKPAELSEQGLGPSQRKKSARGFWAIGAAYARQRDMRKEKECGRVQLIQDGWKIGFRLVR